MRATKSDLAVLQRLYDAQRRMEVQPDSKEAFDEMAAAMKEAYEWLRQNRPFDTEGGAP